MWRATIILVLVTGVMAQVRRVPADREKLTTQDLLPHTVSKIAPLEWWYFGQSPADIKREYFRTDSGFQMHQSNTWEFPRFCFRFFRASPEEFSNLIQAIDEYRGDLVWVYHDDCVSAVTSKPTYYAAPMSREQAEQLWEAVKNPPKADPKFVKRAMDDLPRFVEFLESRLSLVDRSPRQFSQAFLSREQLAVTPNEFDNFMEGGSWVVILAADPAKYIRRQVTSKDGLRLGFGPTESEIESIAKELKGKWDQGRLDIPHYPQLSKLDDPYSDLLFESVETEALFAECLRAQKHVNGPESIRGLDKLIRISRWASKLKLGIVFAGN